MRIWPESPPFSYFHILKISENQTFLPFSLIFQIVPLTICQRKVTNCHFKGNGTLVATSRVRAKELSKVISNNIV